VQKAAARFLEQKLSLLVAFSTGVFLVVTVLLALEVFHIIHSYTEAIAFILLGYVLAAAMQFLLPESHHHHDEACIKKGSAKRIIVGDAVHNIADGIILVPAFLVSTGLGVTVAVSIFIHEALQEISEFFVLRKAGYSVKKALSINFAVSSTILLGAGIAWFSLATATIEGALLAISSGFFLHVLIHDLLPHTKESGKDFKTAVLLMILGAITMFGINVALGETHTHGEDEHGAEHHDEAGHSEEEHHGEEPH
jgi:zinc transporter ZupT